MVLLRLRNPLVLLLLAAAVIAALTGDPASFVIITSLPLNLLLIVDFSLRYIVTRFSFSSCSFLFCSSYIRLM